jgi:hypothetical protein
MTREKDIDKTPHQIAPAEAFDGMLSLYIIYSALYFLWFIFSAFLCLFLWEEECKAEILHEHSLSIILK